MLNIIFVGLGGFVGAVLRYLIGLIPIKGNEAFPINTLIINVIGAFAIGIIAALATKNKELNPQLILFLKVGICGGFTTFSTFALETQNLLKAGNMFLAFLYIILSVILSISAVFLAQMIIK